MKFLTNILEKRKRKQQLIDSNYGRSEGWDVNYKNKTIAILTKPVFVEMFWFSYNVSFIGDLKEQKMNRRLFEEQANLEYYSRAMGEYAKYVFITDESLKTNNVVVRGLYILE